MRNNDNSNAIDVTQTVLAILIILKASIAIIIISELKIDCAKSMPSLLTL